MISKTDCIVKTSKLRTVIVVYETKKITDGTDETMRTEWNWPKFLYTLKLKVSGIKWGTWNS